MKSFCALLMLLALSDPCIGQGDVEVLSGLVLINDRRPGEMANRIEVELKEEHRLADGVKTTVTADGEYHFNGLRPAAYFVTARAPGYKTVTIKVDLIRGSRARQSTRLVLSPEMALPGHIREGGVVSQNELRAPKEARREVQRAEQALERDDLITAAEALDKALAAYPRYARALFQKGRLLEKQQQTDSAANSYEEAIREDMDYFPAYLRLSEVYRTAANVQNLRKIAERWKKIQPLEGTPYYYSALARFEGGEFKLALEDAIMARHFPNANLPHLNLLLANCYIRLREPQAAAEALREFLSRHSDDPMAPQARATLAELQKITAP